MNLNLNRGISTPLSITIVVVIGLLAIGAILAYDYYIDTGQTKDLTTKESKFSENEKEPEKKEDIFKKIVPINEEYILKNNFGPLNYNSIAIVDVELLTKLESISEIVDGASVKYGNLVKVNIVKSSEVFNYANLEMIVDSYNKVDWESSLLHPPAYPIIFKIQNKVDVTQQIVLWYSDNYFVSIEGKNILFDGSDAENVLEAYDAKYPSSVLPPGL